MTQAATYWSVERSTSQVDDLTTLAAEADARYLADRGRAANRAEPISPALRAYTPRSVRTLMSNDVLGRHGLGIFELEAQPWLVPLDADRLVGRPPSAAWLSSLAARLDELRALAVEEEVQFREASAAAAMEFAREINATQRPGAFLIGNGAVRLLWSEGTEQIGLQFKDDGIIQYVLMAQRDTRVSTHMGDDDRDGILRQISAVGLRHLLGQQ